MKGHRLPTARRTGVVMHVGGSVRGDKAARCELCGAASRTIGRRSAGAEPGAHGVVAEAVERAV
ncbi:hypothetical protein, partial [Burkholderia multivorans]|uniref:hypothetical protein n=1 Tax=Burkholderia multivorans TaxID=87883 RepID=UPI0028700736